MALVIDVTYRKTSEAKSYVYKDANFKTIEKTLPKYIDFTSNDIVVYKEKRGISINENQRTPRKIFTSSKRRYELYHYDIDGNFINLERILKSEGIESGSSIPGIWKVQLGPLINMQDNSMFDREAIKNSIKNLFTFHLRERILIPGFGNCLDDMIGSSMTDGQMVIAKEMVEKMMEWERRIDLTDVDLKYDPDNYEILIKITYSIPSIKVASETLSVLINVRDD